mmetsp:Transcript_52602/g.94688  ORF Transcript_52602/g.94688 Transcript_52602/m.94688 type:complete len:346 (-) Transcript_52602:22-1059(-)
MAEPTAIASWSATSVQAAPFLPLLSADVVLVMAICSNCIMVLAPMRLSLQEAHHELGTKEMLALIIPIITIFAQCYYWACYGFLKGQIDIARFNLFGAGLCLAYLLYICRGSQMRKRAMPCLVLAVAALLGMSACIMGSPMPSPSKAQVCAYIAMVFSFLQSSTPLAQALGMLRSKSASGFSMQVALSSWISNMLWAEYAHLIQDRMYFMSNSLNSVVCGAALLLAAIAKLSFAAAAEVKPLMPRSNISMPSKGLWNSLLSLLSPGRSKAEISSDMGEGMAFHTYNSYGSGPGIKCLQQKGSIDLPVKSPFGIIQVDDELEQEPEVEPDWDDEATGPHMSLDCVL